MNQTISSILKFNYNRNESLVQLKYKAMHNDIFRFYRGTCHLFFEDNSQNNLLNDAPNTWICGDLHLENFGSYKGDNRLVYFDMNDFDEALLAPCLWDLSRFLCSIIVAHKILGIKKDDANILAESVLKTYVNTLQKAHAKFIQTETSKGVIKDFLDDLKQRKRKELIDKRTEIISGKRRIKVDGIKTLDIDDRRKDEIKYVIDNWSLTQENKDFYKVLDIAVRIVGTGSIGLERYAILVDGNGKDNHYLLDLKIAMPSSLQNYSNATQPKWNTDAERIIEIQQRMQAVSPALLHVIEMDGKSFVLKELQPSQDKLDLTVMGGKIKKLTDSLNTFAEILAWDQLRSSGRQGSAIADELIDFVNRTDWQQPLLNFCSTYFEKVKTDYEIFCNAFDEGEFNKDEDEVEMVS
jgi:uncharacterized protein (DUF2252 family)